MTNNQGIKSYQGTGISYQGVSVRDKSNIRDRDININISNISGGEEKQNEM